jgi:hypothetical protein
MKSPEEESTTTSDPEMSTPSSLEVLSGAAADVDDSKPDEKPVVGLRDGQLVFIVKWTASIVQIAGYTATAFGWTPINLYLFMGGVVGWFTVGLLWNDRAIILIHIVACVAMIAGMIST